MMDSAQRTWDEIAEEYDEHRRRDVIYAACISAVADAAGPTSGGTALDCGAGTGLVTQRLAPMFGRVVALDLSRRSLELLRRKPGCERAILVQADARRLPFPDGVFDAVVCANTLQHLRPGADQLAGAGELVRVARPGGTVAVTVHHYSRRKRRQGWIKQGRPGQAGVDYIFRFERDELAALLPGARIRSVGFESLARVPKVSLLLQRVATRILGQRLARRGDGHMLLAMLRRGGPTSRGGGAPPSNFDGPGANSSELWGTR